MDDKEFKAIERRIRQAGKGEPRRIFWQNSYALDDAKALLAEVNRLEGLLHPRCMCSRCTGVEIDEEGGGDA